MQTLRIRKKRRGKKPTASLANHEVLAFSKWLESQGYVYRSGSPGCGYVFVGVATEILVKLNPPDMANSYRLMANNDAMTALVGMWNKEKTGRSQARGTKSRRETKESNQRHSPLFPEDQYDNKQQATK